MRMWRVFRGVSAVFLPVLCVLALAATARADLLGDVHFPLHVSADGRHLEDSLGRPFLINADAAWSLMVVPTQQEAEAYLEDRHQRGFNTVLVNLIERGFGGPENAAGDPPFIPANDFTAPNEAYFAYADWLIDRAAAKGMLVLLTPAYLGIQCGSQGWCEQMLDQPVSAMTTYGRYLGDRYRTRNNVLWVNGGDADAASFGAANHVNAIANGIAERAPNQLQTAHCKRQESGIDCYDEPWLDVNTTYSNCDSTLDHVIDDYLRAPPILFFFIEGGYEGNSGDLDCVIEQHVWSVLGGSTGHVFGNDPIWRFGDGWQDELDSPGSQAMTHISDLFLSRAWFRLSPDLDGSVLPSSPPADSIGGLTSDGESLLAYVPGTKTVAIRTSGIANSQARAWWFDPKNGNSSLIGLVPTTGTVNFSFTGGKVLVVDNAAQNLPAPGSQRYVVPEPASTSLLGAGGALLAWLSRRRSRARRSRPGAPA